MAEQDSMETTITRRKWTWIGHTMRKAGSSITKKALRWTPQGCRDRGRPKNTWKRTVEKELGNMKLSWSEAESKAQDWAEWRSIVGGLCSGRSWKARKEGRTRLRNFAFCIPHSAYIIHLLAGETCSRNTRYLCTFRRHYPYPVYWKRLAISYTGQWNMMCFVFLFVENFCI